MDEKKIEYLKKHLEQALSEDNYNEVNSSYQELLKHFNATDIPDLAQRVSDYNRAHSKNHAQGVAASAEDIKQRMRSAKAKHNINVKIQVTGLAGGVCAMIFGCFLVMCGAGVFGSYNDPIMYGGLAVTIIGGGMILIGTIFAFIKNKSQIILNKCKNEVFNLICKSEEKLNYLEKVETVENKYVGQVQNGDQHGLMDFVPNGFGVFAQSDFIYVGEWKNGSESGIGKLITYDMLMTLEGEFKEDQANGVVDIQWEDGNEWHGEYKNGLPWNGQGKTIVKNKIQQGTWKNGMKIS